MTNNASLCGEVFSPPTLSHESHGVYLYRCLLSVPRLSGNIDVLPILCPEALKARLTGKVFVQGQLRGYTIQGEDRRHLQVCVLAKTIGKGELPENNKIELSGELYKEPYYRKTPMGREICDLILRVSRPYAGIDFIPCVVWGKCAAFCKHLKKGAFLQVSGRLQSREYVKVTENTEEVRTAYELSVNKLSVLSY